MLLQNVLRRCLSEDKNDIILKHRHKNTVLYGTEGEVFA